MSNIPIIDDYVVKEENPYCKFIPGVGVQLDYIQDFEIVADLKSEDANKYNMLSILNFSKKTIYMNIGEEISQYINYFRKYYEKQGYLTYLYMYMNTRIIESGAILAESTEANIEFIDPYTEEEFLDDILKVFLNNKILSLIDKMVDDNYFEFDMMKKKSTNKSSAVDAVQFNSNHAKACLKFAVASKLVIPVIGQYSEYRLARNQNTAFFMHCFKVILKRVTGDTCDLEVKLRSIAKLAVQQTKNSDRQMWDKMETTEGGTKHNKINEIMKHLVQNMPKVVFKKALVAYFHNIAKKQVAFLFKQKFDQITSLDENRDEDGLSDFDKVEINIIKDDESKSIINDKNAQLTIVGLEKMYGKIPQDEIDFYKEHIPAEGIKDLQRALLFYIFANDFGGLRQMYSINYDGYIKLICLAKRRLKPYGLMYIPQFISARMNRVNTRKTINTILLRKLENSPQYLEMLESKYKNTKLLVDGKSVIVGMMSKFMNTPMFIIDYDMYIENDILYHTLEISSEIMMDEFIKTIEMI
ncbi:MAG: hypothetical protein ACRC0G_07770 [Fusobacteriaceae bacterium]